MFVPERKRWTEAEADCVVRGGHLASIGGQKENDAVQSLCSEHRYCWIGGTKENSVAATAGSAATTGWGWSNGASVTYTNFETSGGQRVGDSSQPFTFLRPSTGQWQFDADPDPSAMTAYVCKIGKQPTHVACAFGCKRPGAS